MISRNTTLILAEAFEHAFFDYYYSSPRQNKTYRVDNDALYDFLFGNNYPAWFCNKSKRTHNYSRSEREATRGLREFIMQLHTGETLYEGTNQWTWQQREQLGQQYLYNLAEDILNSNKISKDTKQKLIRSLELDGYIYKDSRLLAPESDILDVREEEGILEALYTILSLGNKETAFHHLSLSREHYLNQRWDDSISNSRKFFECTLQEVAISFSNRVRETPLAETEYTKPVRVREYLQRENLLDSKEKGVVDSIYGLLSETGGHPYMAQNDQARLLRYLALTVSQFVLLRLQGSLSKSS